MFHVVEAVGAEVCAELDVFSVHDYADRGNLRYNTRLCEGADFSSNDLDGQQKGSVEL